MNKAKIIGHSLFCQGFEIGGIVTIEKSYSAKYSRKHFGVEVLSHRCSNGDLRQLVGDMDLEKIEKDS